MLNGLSLFSGIGGIDVALSEWVRPIAYCEIDSFCQAVLLSRMGDNQITRCPIWDDIGTFSGSYFCELVDIIYGGFPCQNLSVAGAREGLAGKQSGLFYEILRLCREIEPRWLFLENVPGLVSLGGTEVVRELTALGYDCRWCVISAASVGALHRRERWFLLAHSNHSRSHGSSLSGSPAQSLSNSQEGTLSPVQSERMDSSRDVAATLTANSPSLGRDERPSEGIHSERRTIQHEESPYPGCPSVQQWRETVSSMGKCSDGIPNRMARLRCLGNAVVPIQAKEAFKILMGLK